MATVRRPKWQPPPPQPPCILHLPRPATRRRQGTRSAVSDQLTHRRPPKGQLETLFGQERTLCYTIPPAFLLNSTGRSKAEDHDGLEVGIWKEKWRFQAEILRAECKFLRMEREISAKRLQRERVFIERSLKSAVHALISAKRKIGEGENAEFVLEEEIEELKMKLSELQKSSKKATRRDPELLKGNRGAKNSVNGSTLLQKQLQRIGGLEIQKCNMDFGEIAKANLFKLGIEDGSLTKESDPNEACNRLAVADVEVLRRKMEGLSKGKLFKKMEEEYGLMVSGTANSASTSKLSSSSSSVQEPLQEGKLLEHNICGGHCKILVRRIMEQVRAETDQWSQMQEMLGQVREEMEELQAKRDFWEDQALNSDYKIKSLNKTVQEWKEKAVFHEGKEKQLEELVKVLQEDVERARMENEVLVRVKSKESAHKSWRAIPSQEKENNVLSCRVKGKGRADDNCVKAKDALNHGKKALSGSKFMSASRLPFMDIGNLSPFSSRKIRLAEAYEIRRSLARRNERFGVFLSLG